MVVVPVEEVVVRDGEEMESVEAEEAEEMGEEMSYQRLAMLFGQDGTT